MLAGSILAECSTGQVGDKFVSSDFSCPLGILAIIGKRNAEYAARKHGTGLESSVTALHQPDHDSDVLRDSSTAPEKRLVIALLGMITCIVGRIRLIYQSRPR